MATVEGVRETIRELRSVDSELAREAIKRIKAPAYPAAGRLKGAAPAVPLSRMGYHGPVRVSVNYGGKPKGDLWPLVRIRLMGPSWTMASDVAHNSAPGETMVPNLNAKYGGPSRWVWPTIEAATPAMIHAITSAVDHVIAETNRSLSWKG